MTGPLRPLDLLASLWTTATTNPFFTMSRLVAGRRVGLRVDDTDLTLTIAEFDSRLDLRALTAGQLGNLHLAARDIDWGGTRFTRASATLHNIYVQAAAPPVLVAAPVELTVDVPVAALDDLFAGVAPRYRAHVGPDGVARLRLTRRPGWGYLELDAQLDGAVLRLTPRRVAIGRRGWPLPARVPSYPIRLPELPHGLQLTGIGFGPGHLRLEGVVPEWQLPVVAGATLLNRRDDPHSKK